MGLRLKMSSIEKAIEKLGRAKKTLGDSGKTVPEHVAEQAADKSADQLQSFVMDRNVQTPHQDSPSEATAEARAPSDLVKWDISRLEAAGLVMKDGEKNPIAEEYRQIKRPLLINAFSQGASAIQNANLIMITSALPGEGKTFTAINLAMSIALERDRTVLLVDADVAKPGVSEYIGKTEWPGLVDYLLSDTMQLSDVLVKTDVPKLNFCRLAGGTLIQPSCWPVKASDVSLRSWLAAIPTVWSYSIRRPCWLPAKRLFWPD